MKRYIRSAIHPEDPDPNTIWNFDPADITSPGKLKPLVRFLNYSKLSNLQKGIRLAYSSDKCRQGDLKRLYDSDILTIADISTDDATDWSFPPDWPYYIRIKLRGDVAPDTKNIKDQDFKNVDSRDIDVLHTLVDYGIIPTVSTSSALKNNQNYKDSHKYIDLISQDDNSRTYDIPYNKHDFFGNRIYSTPITIYDDGQISIDDNAPMLLKGNVSKLKQQFKQSHYR